MLPRAFLIALVFIGNTTISAAHKATVSFMLTFNGQPVKLDGSWYHLPDGDSISFETFKCYISHVRFYDHENQVFEEKNSYHLLDASKPEGMDVVIESKDLSPFNGVELDIGIDSATNVSGAMGGDLDPTNGMYWAWQSGYINLKLEGKSNKCATRNHEFQFHLGGYTKNENSLQHITLHTQQREDMIVEIKLETFISAIDLSKQNEVMIPGKEAVELSAKFAKTVETYLP